MNIALAGNPNCGKTTLFNALTGSRQHVGNWPGKTVELRIGTCRHGDRELSVIDLPGTYSLAAVSAEEIVARDYLLDERPDVVVIVVDASNAERNLYLAVQILELGIPAVVALNMTDVAEAGGQHIDAGLLAEALGVPVVPMVARRSRRHRRVAGHGGGRGQESHTMSRGLLIDYGPVVGPEVERLVAEIDRHPAVESAFPARWLALELLEDGEDLRVRLAAIDGGAAVVAASDAARARLVAAYGDRAVVAIAGRRYDWINDVVSRTVTRSAGPTESRSDRIDRVVTHRWLGIPIFLAAMWIVFKLTADVSSVFLDWIDGVIAGPLARWVGAAVTAAGLGDTWVRSLLIDGVVAGVGGIAVFVPVLMTLYLCLAILEDSGYMARAALVMDRTMRRLGLPGKSFLPMLVGFGCTVPAVFATRTLERRQDRILTGLLVPFMSCAARLPVYVLVATIFFPRHRGAVVFSMYLLGIGVAMVLGLVLSRTVFKGSIAAPLVMELPPYRRPTPTDIWAHVWMRTTAFIRDAGTIILGTSMVLWLLMAMPVAGAGFADTPVEDSVFGRAASAAAPAFAPAGFGSWESVGSLAAGFVAKEVVITSLSQVHGVEVAAVPGAEPSVVEDLALVGSGFLVAARDTVLALPGIVGIDLLEHQEDEQPTRLVAAIRDDFAVTSGGHGTAAALAFMVFVLLYTPCMAAVAAERHELGRRWMWVSIIGQTGLAWVMAVVVFQAAVLLGVG